MLAWLFPDNRDILWRDMSEETASDAVSLTVVHDGSLNVTFAQFSMTFEKLIKLRSATERLVRPDIYRWLAPDSGSAIYLRSIICLALPQEGIGPADARPLTMTNARRRDVGKTDDDLGTACLIALSAAAMSNGSCISVAWSARSLRST